ncbi:MAG: glycosyltransferase family 4 protein [bacterium]|nr:glycosyltransferase family 4 protein [bacterium]
MAENLPEPPRSLRVLYARGKRAKWWPLLEASEYLTADAVRLYDPDRRPSIAPGRLVRAMRRFRPDLILAEYSGIRHLPLLPVCSLYRLPLVVAVKGDPWLEAAERGANRLARRLNLWSSSLLLRHADLLLPLTEALERSVKRHLGDRPCRVVPIPYQEPAIPEPPGIDSPYLLTVTNFRFRAKVEPLMRTASVLAPLLEELDLEWLILGDGTHLPACRERLRRFSHRIRFLGFSDAASYYRDARLFLYPSGLDGLPNVVLEAALHRLPILVDRVSPAAELITDGETGQILDPDDPAGTVETVRELLADNERRARLGAAAASWVRRRFAPSRVAAELEAALAAVPLSRSRDGR